MMLIKIGSHTYINLDNVSYSVRVGKKVTVFFVCAGATVTSRKPYFLDLFDPAGDEFERKLENLCS